MLGVRIEWQDDGNPSGFRIRGKLIPIAETLDRWYGEGESYLKVSAGDGTVFILRKGDAEGWEMIFMETPAAVQLR